MRITVLPLAVAALLSACASLSPAPQPAAGANPPFVSGPPPDVQAAAAQARAAGAPMALPSIGAPPPFAAVVRDAKRIDGPLVLWQKDDRVWIELAPDQFGKPFLLSPKIKSGIGEAWVLGGLMSYPSAGIGGAQVVEFVRVYNQVRLQARNVDVTAAAGSPEARAVESSYSHSLLGSSTVASQPNPETKAVLVEANPLFLTDMLGVGMLLQRAYHQGYSLDPRHTTISAVRSSPAGVEIETQNHYYASSLQLPQPGQSSPRPSLPRFVPDARSVLVGHHYSLSPLPAEPMPARRADPRIGLFSNTVLDFSNDLARTPRQRLVHRWRLEKKDPAAEMSEPVKPITFWIDRNVPLAYRDTVRGAILEWNKAFEKIGFRNAVVVEQQPDDAAFDTLDAGHAAVRWMMNADPSFAAIGPSHVDPRSGEILDAVIAFEGMETRVRRTERSQVLTQSARSADSAFLAAVGVRDPEAAAPVAEAAEQCMFGDLAAEQLGYGLDILAARDDLDPGGPEAQQYVHDYVKDTIMHEVGHALGLRHNFRASRVYDEAQLSDPEFTREHGTTGSVMEYNAINLPRPGEHGGTPFQTTLGPYDYWAIEYAYKPFARADEAAELQRIAARSSEPLLAYGTDDDSAFGLDPETIQLDLGSDPIAFASKRIDIARDLFRRQETRALAPDRDYAVLRRTIGYALTDVTRAVAVLARQIGGVRTLRDFPGSGRDPLQPVDARLQRQALDLIVQAILGADGLSLSPAVQRKLAPDYLDRAEFGIATDYALPQRLLDLQRGVVGYLMSDAVAARVIDSDEKFDRPADAFPLSELYARLTRAVWSDLEHGTAARREVQRDHVNRLAAGLLRPQSRADARALQREQAQALLARLEAANRKPQKLDAATRAHLADSAETLRQALAAKLPRVGV